MGSSISVRAFELQHDVACAVAFKPFVGNRRTGNVTAQTFELMALMGGTVDVGVQAEAVFGGTQLLGGLHRLRGNGLQGQDFLAGAGAECDSVGAGRRLQRRQGKTGVGFGQIGHALLFNQNTLACQYNDEIPPCISLFGSLRGPNLLQAN